MKVFFDTNVYVGEALVGEGAQAVIIATENARWRIFISSYILDELQRVLIERLNFSRQFAVRSRDRALSRASLVETPASRHKVAEDPNDTPVLAAALATGADLLVTNDRHLLALNPYHSLRIISITDYFDLLVDQGLLSK